MTLLCGFAKLDLRAKEPEKIMFTTKAKVQVKNPQGKVVASQEYDKVVFHGTSLNGEGEVTGGTPEELLGDAIAYFQKQVGEKGNGVVEMLKHVTYGSDLNVKSTIRQGLTKALEGPDKAIEKAAKDIMAARAAIGKPITMEQALVRAKATLED